MKSELKQIGLALGLGMLASTMSSCSLLGKQKAMAQWEIQSEVPASLNNGRATSPASGAVKGNIVKSNLDGLAPIDESALDLPAMENGMLADIPKPEGIYGHLAQQSPPEMLSIPATGAAGEVPHVLHLGQNLAPLLPAPPPAVTEEELAIAPAALTPQEAAMAVPPPELNLAPAPQPAPEIAAVPLAAPSIPLLYGKLDLGPFLNPPTPLAVITPLPPPGQ